MILALTLAKTWVVCQRLCGAPSPLIPAEATRERVHLLSSHGLPGRFTKKGCHAFSGEYRNKADKHAYQAMNG